MYVFFVSGLDLYEDSLQPKDLKISIYRFCLSPIREAPGRSVHMFTNHVIDFARQQKQKDRPKDLAFGSEFYSNSTNSSNKILSIYELQSYILCEVGLRLL